MNLAAVPKMGIGIVWVFVLIATAAYSQSSASIVDHDIVFGPQQRMSGVYFSNFENSKFTACDRSTSECDGWAERESGDGVLRASRLC